MSSLPRIGVICRNVSLGGGVSRSIGPALALVAFSVAFVVCFVYYDVSNDHYDRLVRARQIAVYGDVPFRDFFDPGYFLTLYTSALFIRVFGENLLGEAIINLTGLALGTTIVFAIASRVTRSFVWGSLAALLVVVSEPRPYDYDKILFYPLGLAVCWHYCERPSKSALIALSAVIAVSGLFRYDSAVYIGAAAGSAIVARHWRDWATAARRLTAASALVVLFASPALAYIQATAGLGTAIRQVMSYARVEGDRTRVFEPATFRFDWQAPLVGTPSSQGGVGLAEKFGWLPGIVTPNNAAAWLYWTAAVLSVAMVVLLPLSRGNRRSEVVSKALCLSVMLALVTAFVLRDPFTARVATVMPLVVIGGSWVVGEWRNSNTLSTHTTGWPSRLTGSLVSGLVAITATAVIALLWVPPLSMFNVLARARVLVETPTPMSQLPRGEIEPLVTYLTACTTTSDRVLIAWFAPEIPYFSRRGFGAGLPVVFGGHWSSLAYQRRSLELLQGQSVPVIVTRDSPPFGNYAFLQDFVLRHYDLAFQGKLGVSPSVAIWTRKDRRPIRTYPGPTLPCFAA